MPSPGCRDAVILCRVVCWFPPIVICPDQYEYLRVTLCLQWIGTLRLELTDSGQKAGETHDKAGEKRAREVSDFNTSLPVRVVIRGST